MPTFNQQLSFDLPQPVAAYVYPEGHTSLIGEANTLDTRLNEVWDEIHRLEKQTRVKCPLCGAVHDISDLTHNTYYESVYDGTYDGSHWEVCEERLTCPRTNEDFLIPAPRKGQYIKYPNTRQFYCHQGKWFEHN